MKRKLSVLIVDDNQNYVRRMVALLNEEEIISSIHTAQNYDEAHLLLDKRPDLALLDIQLPGKNGIHLLKTIKDSSKDCEVFMVTNSTGDYYREQCRKLGALRFFDKTNDFELVAGGIRDFATQNFFHKSMTAKRQ
jgi:two-component system chemotaxis response regulator CheY